MFGLLNSGLKTLTFGVFDAEEEAKAADSVLNPVIKVGTFGVVNINEGGLTLKDPIMGTMDNIGHLIDIVSDESRERGVWIGQRPIKDLKVGFSLAPLRAFNLDVTHSVVSINGIAYTLEVDTGFKSIMKLKEMDLKEKNECEWRSKGKVSKYAIEIQQYIDIFNDAKRKYDLIYKNCHDVSQSIAQYFLNAQKTISANFFSEYVKGTFTNKDGTDLDYSLVSKISDYISDLVDTFIHRFDQINRGNTDWNYQGNSIKMINPQNNEINNGNTKQNFQVNSKQTINPQNNSKTPYQAKGCDKSLNQSSTICGHREDCQGNVCKNRKKNNSEYIIINGVVLCNSCKPK